METAQEYQVDLSWQENQNARVSAVVFSNTLAVAPHSCLESLNNDAWSAEYLFIASMASSYMTAFFRAAKNKRIKFKTFKSAARASVLISAESSEITDIVIRPEVTISESNQINRTLKLFSVCTQHCMVLKALKVRLHIFPSVHVERW
jgi:organic hydroperoxide reductase OsmC/OhrA